MYHLQPRLLPLASILASIARRPGQASLVSLNVLDLASSSVPVSNQLPSLGSAVHTSTTAGVGGATGPVPAVNKLPSFGEVEYESEVPHFGEGLSKKDAALVQLYIGACNHYWSMLPDLADACYSHGATEAEVQGAVRHIIVFAGYAPCLAATITLRTAKKLAPSGQHLPGKVGGPPGNAFELVYDKVTDIVRAKLHDWDPVLAEYIRLHLYGDVYSGPGLTMSQKQLLTVAFLGEAQMHDQLYTHLIAALRFGANPAQCMHAIKIGFHMSPRPNVLLRPILRGARKQLEQAVSKFERVKGSAGEPEVLVPDPSSICVPPLPPKVFPDADKGGKGDD